MPDEVVIVEEDEDYAPATDEEASALTAKLTTLKERCDAAGIEFVQDIDEDGDPYARLGISAGRAKRRIAAHSVARVDDILSIEFERYKFITGYDCILSYENKYIEVGVRSTRGSEKFIIQRLQGKRVDYLEEVESIILSPADDQSGRPIMEVGACSREFMVLCGMRPGRFTLKLRGVRANQHDQALAELRSYADSLFFQIDIMLGTTFILQRERRLSLLQPTRRPREIRLEYPSAHYNEEAMSLYWYAKSAPDLPLLRFLAFYQSVEFYFPRYSQTEARKRIGTIVKNPTFRPHRDDDLDKLISAIQLARGGGLGSEKSQLRAVIAECFSAEDMREYLSATPGRAEYFAGKGSKAKYHKVIVANKNADLRNDVADRIYDIRCKIVHTKNENFDDDIPMILPFSEDADLLLADIELMEFVARGVLVSSSGELV